MSKNIVFCVMLMAASSAVIIYGCKLKSPTDMHTSRISMDWAGDYYGILPNDLFGNAFIYAKITLNRDLTFDLQYQYLGKAEGFFTEKGTFEWDESGDIIMLSFSYLALPRYYRVGGKRLIMLEMDGKTISGIFGDNYVLRKPFEGEPVNRLTLSGSI